LSIRIIGYTWGGYWYKYETRDVLETLLSWFEQHNVGADHGA